MRSGKVIHYIVAVVAGMISFVLGHALLQEFVTRNLPDDSVLQLATRFILNFSAAGFMSGAVYAATFKGAYLPIATIPATLVGGFFLGVAIVRGEIGYGLEHSLSAWQFCDPSRFGDHLQLHQCKDHAPLVSTTLALTRFKRSRFHETLPLNRAASRNRGNGR